MEKRRTVEITQVHMAFGTAAIVLVSLMAGYASYTKAITDIQKEFGVLRTERAEREQNYLKKDEVNMMITVMEEKVERVDNKVDAVLSKLSNIEGYLRRRQNYSFNPSAFKKVAKSE